MLLPRPPPPPCQPGAAWRGPGSGGSAPQGYELSRAALCSRQEADTQHSTSFCVVAEVILRQHKTGVGLQQAYINRLASTVMNAAFITGMRCRSDELTTNCSIASTSQSLHTQALRTPPLCPICPQKCATHALLAVWRSETHLAWMAASASGLMGISLLVPCGKRRVGSVCVGGGGGREGAAG